MDERMTPADHAFESFIASRSARDFRGYEAAMFRFYECNPDGRFRAEAEEAIKAYERKNS